VQSIAVSPNGTGGTNLFVGTSYPYGILQGGISTGIFLSTNNGVSWTGVSSTMANASVSSFAVSPSGAGGTNIFAGTYGGGVYLSAENGTSWTQVNSGLTDPNVTALSLRGSCLFAGTDGGVFLSTNNGTSWTAASTGLNSGVSDFAIRDTNIFAGTLGGVFLSTNNGTSWTAVDSGLTNKQVRVLAVSNKNLFAGTDGGVFLSTNNGESWTAINTGLTGPYAQFVEALAVSGTNLFVGTGSGVFLSTNSGTTWLAVNAGLRNLLVGRLGVDDTYVYAATWKFRPLGVWRRPLSEMVTSIALPCTELPTKSSLDLNYPNPFNPSTTIRYELPKASIVRLSVYDILGREVSVLMNERREAGVHEVKFDGSNLSSGVYFYTLEEGSFVQTKKMMILK
jgi:photosystem II stability/assembly factor-like uncharacterized protein